MTLKLHELHVAESRRGFTLTETVIATALTAIVLVGLISIYIYIFKSWHAIEERMRADSDVNIAISRMIYGMAEHRGIRAAKNVSVDIKGDDWTIWYLPGTLTSQSNSITYSKSDKTITLDPGNHLIGKDISKAEVAIKNNLLEVELEADRKKGDINVMRKISTKIYWRN